MTIEEYFGDWARIIDLKEAERIMKYLAHLKEPVCPSPKDVFKAFRLCSFYNLRVVVLGQDPYFTGGKATGIAFANSSDTIEENYSPSLKVLSESVINFSIPHNRVIFDPSLEGWEEQGVLMLNSSLSCIKNKPGSHMLLWRPFITSFLTNLQKYTYGIVYVLMGSSAESFASYINEYNKVIKCRHPAYYARMKEPMPDIWTKINDILIAYNGYGIEWYKEVKF